MNNFKENSLEWIDDKMNDENEDRVDLHVHSNECDGAEKEEIVTEANNAGLKAIALTDHQITAGTDKVRDIVKRRGLELEVIPAVEISTLEGFDIIGYMIDHHNEHLNNELHRIRLGRQIRAQKMATKLDSYCHNHLGFHVKYEEVSKLTINGNIAGGHFEKFVYEKIKKIAELYPKEYVRVMRKFVDAINGTNPEEPVMFDESWAINAPYCVHFIKETLVRKYLLKGERPCHVGRTPADCLSVKEASDLIDEAGGIKAPAHPGATDKDGLLVKIIKEHNMEALEVLSSKHRIDQNRNYAMMAADMGLVATGGTDWHGVQFTPNLKIGDVHYTTQEGEVIMPTYSMVEALRRIKETKKRT